MADIRITSIDQVQAGLFVKFVDRDKNGRFSYTGEVTSVSIDSKSPKKKKSGRVGYNREEEHIPDHSFEMLTMEGTMGFKMGNPEEDHELFLTTVKPPGWSKFKKDPSRFIREREQKETVAPVKTKKEQVLKLVADNHRKKEGALLKLAKTQIGGSENQLKTFIRLGLSKN